MVITIVPSVCRDFVVLSSWSRAIYEYTRRGENEKQKNKKDKKGFSLFWCVKENEPRLMGKQNNFVIFFFFKENKKYIYKQNSRLV